MEGWGMYFPYMPTYESYHVHITNMLLVDNVNLSMTVGVISAAQQFPYQREYNLSICQ